MKTKTAIALGVGLIVATFLYSLWLYPSLPDRVPTHWNIRGQTDGWGSKQTVLFLMPGISIVLGFLLMALPKISPRNFKVDDFLPTYNYMSVMTIALLSYIHVCIMQATIHPGMDPGRPLVGGIFLFFALMGNLLGKVRRNFWMGIRTPWTLASDAVWIATHRAAARLYTAMGLIGAVMAFAGISLVFCFVFLIVGAFVPVVQSYWFYKRLETG